MAKKCLTCTDPNKVVDPDKPINPNTGENYNDDYPVTLQGLTYNTGASTDIVGTQVDTEHINPNTGVNFTDFEVEAYKRPKDYEAYLSEQERVGNQSGKYGQGGFDANVPGYEKSPEQQAWEDQYSGYLQDSLENPQGIPEDVKQQLNVDMFNTLKAQESENIRVMRNNMERRGITNSGFQYSNEQKIRSNTTKVMAQNIRNIEIQDAMMKLSSFKNAMGRTAQYLGYLSDESYKAYQPKLMEWQAKFDVYKMQLNQAYQQQNMQLQAQLTGQLQQQQNAFQMEMFQMELEASQNQAKTQGLWNIIGTIGGAFISSIFNPFKLFGV
jgi:hypothetical protein